jgi:hypothetical protein
MCGLILGTGSATVRKSDCGAVYLCASTGYLARRTVARDDAAKRQARNRLLNVLVDLWQANGPTLCCPRLHVFTTAGSANDWRLGVYPDRLKRSKELGSNSQYVRRMIAADLVSLTNSQCDVSHRYLGEITHYPGLQIGQERDPPTTFGFSQP